MGPHQSKTRPKDSGKALQGKTVPKARPLLEHTLRPVVLNQAGPSLEAGSAQGPPSFAELRSWNMGIGLGHYVRDGGKDTTVGVRTSLLSGPSHFDGLQSDVLIWWLGGL